MNDQGSKRADAPESDGAPKKTSRRDLIAGATGGLAVLTAEALVRAAPAHADNGDPVTLGQTNTETDLTQIEHTGSTGDAVFKALSSNTIGVPGLIGQSTTATGVRGISTDGEGVFGQSTSVSGIHGTTASNGANDGGVFGESSAAGNGVRGTSVSGAGVRGETTNGPQGVLGVASTSIGVRGLSDSGNGVSGMSSSAVGVYGQTAGGSVAAVLGTNNSGGPGVSGNSGTGDGVVGSTDFSGSGNGVKGTGPTGVFGNGNSYGVFALGGTAGVHAEGAEGIQGVTTSLSGGVGVHGTRGVSGIGVLGQTFGSTSTGVKADAAAGGTALQVNGKAVFSRSGILTVPMGSDQATQTSVDLTSASLVLATMQDDRSGNFVRAAVPSVGTSSFTVLLNKKVTTPTKVGWMVVN